MRSMKWMEWGIPTHSLALLVGLLLVSVGSAVGQCPPGVGSTYYSGQPYSLPVCQGSYSLPMQSGYTIQQSRGLSLGGYRSRVVRPLGSPMTTYGTYSQAGYVNPFATSLYGGGVSSCYSGGMMANGGISAGFATEGYAEPVGSGRCIMIMVCPGY